MSFLKRLSTLFTPRAKVQRVVYPLTVQCSRCGEIIAAPVDLRNDMSAEFDETTGAMTYVCRKVLMGRQRCFQQIEVVLHLDASRKLQAKEVTGGKFVEEPPQP